MTLTQGRTETNDTQATIDDVEGHRIAPFVEDYKDDALGRRRRTPRLGGESCRSWNTAPRSDRCAPRFSTSPTSPVARCRTCRLGASAFAPGWPAWAHRA